MEKWEEIFVGKIPKDNYQALVKNGEECGLSIFLESNTNVISVNFGNVSALRMLDEGILLNGGFEEQEIAKYRQNKFSNTIYKIYHGEFGEQIKSYCADLYEHLGLAHYVIITMNYVIEVISEWEPTIYIKEK